MSDIAIKVENLHKLYRLGIKDEENETLVQTAFSWIKAPKKNFANLRKLTTFDLDTEDPDVLHALNDVSFEVKHAEVLGIIGRNGAGKSTLLKVLSRITEPTSGRATINGRVASLLEVGTGFHPELTGRENIYMNGTILGMGKKEIDRKFDEIVDFSGVERFLDTPVKRYSSGMKVRLAFSVAAHLEPEILIIDEVLAVGDSVFQKKCLGKMETVAKKGRTVLFVSHQMEAILNLCSRCLLMENGCVVQEGRTETVISEYLNKFTENHFSSDLGRREDRKGVGNFRFKKTWLEDKNGNICSAFKSGDFVRIVAEYEANEEFTKGNVIVASPFSNIKNGLFTDLSNRLTGNIINIVPSQKGKVYCDIESIPLNSGEYFYDLYAKSEFTLEDWIEKAAMITIESGDFYKTGQLPLKDRTFLIEHSWRLK